MSTLVDHQIEKFNRFHRELIRPFNPSQVNPASYDVRLAKDLLIESPCGKWLKATTPYMMEPGEFLLGVTQEKFRLPSNIEAIFMLKSSRGREGYEHVLSGYIDPGYTGNITLELVNVNRFRKLPLEEGMLIGQIRFMFTDSNSSRPYDKTGHYQNDTTVKPSMVDIFGRSMTSH
jgi:dCTP deaminase